MKPNPLCTRQGMCDQLRAIPEMVTLLSPFFVFLLTVQFLSFSSLLYCFKVGKMLDKNLDSAFELAKTDIYLPHRIPIKAGVAVTEYTHLRPNAPKELAISIPTLYLDLRNWEVNS